MAADYDAKDLKNWADSQLSSNDGGDVEEGDDAEDSDEEMSEEDQGKALSDAADKIRQVVGEIQGQIDQAQSDDLLSVANTLEKLSGVEASEDEEDAAPAMEDSEDSEDDDGSED